MTVVSGAQFAPIAIGSIRMVTVYCGGHISGALNDRVVAIGQTVVSRVRGSIGIYLVGSLAGGAAAW